MTRAEPQNTAFQLEGTSLITTKIAVENPYIDYATETVPPEDIKILFDILRTKRPADSKTEAAVVNEICNFLGDGVEVDDAGNLIYRIGKSRTLFSCHTDTVHQDDGLQSLFIDPIAKHVFADGNADCLGADDGAGMWLMLMMIKRNKPGLYIFHRGEECGGIGSRHIAHKTPELLEHVDRAIAFDRKGFNDIITTQRGRTCCSDAFAEALGSQLDMKSATGSFTDTANYTELVPECTNLSVGYFHQHTPREYQDVEFLVSLLDRLMDVDFEALPIVRDPKPVSITKSTTSRKRPYYYNSRKYDDDFDFWLPATDYKEVMKTVPEALEFIIEHPMAAAVLLKEIYTSEQRVSNIKQAAAQLTRQSFGRDHVNIEELLMVLATKQPVKTKRKRRQKTPT